MIVLPSARCRIGAHWRVTIGKVQGALSISAKKRTRSIRLPPISRSSERSAAQ
jgi:hypothetical protein